MKNILIYSNYLPNEGWGGGVIIRSLTFNHNQNINFYWASPNSNEKDESCNNIKIVNFNVTYINGRGKIKFVRWIESKLFSNRFLKTIKFYKIDSIWIVLATSYDYLYKMNMIVNKISIPIHISVHDDPIIELEPLKQKSAKTLFNSILNKAHSIDVISSRMKDKYKNDYNVDSIEITRCINDDFPFNNELDNESINIIMGGYGNAPKPWPIPFIEAIKLFDSKYKCKLHLFDSKLTNFSSQSIIVHNLMEEKKYNQFLKKMNIGYACDDLKNEKFAQLSLPTKIITYIGAGIPFIYHGPNDSTVNDLIMKIEVGIVVQSNDVNDLYNSLIKIHENYSYYRDNCIEARNTIYSQVEIQSNFYKYILT